MKTRKMNRVLGKHDGRKQFWVVAAGIIRRYFDKVYRPIQFKRRRYRHYVNHVESDLPAQALKESGVSSQSPLSFSNGGYFSVDQYTSARKHYAMSADLGVFPSYPRKFRRVVHYIDALVGQSSSIYTNVQIGFAHDVGDHDSS